MMLWTVFTFLIVVWMAGLVIRFGGSAVPMVLVLATVMLVLRLVVRRRSFR